MLWNKVVILKLFMQTVYESLAGSTSIEEERREIQDTLPLLWGVCHFTLYTGQKFQPNAFLFLIKIKPRKIQVYILEC